VVLVPGRGQSTGGRGRVLLTKKKGEARAFSYRFLGKRGGAADDHHLLNAEALGPEKKRPVVVEEGKGVGRARVSFEDDLRR